MTQFHRISILSFTPFTNQSSTLLTENHDLLEDYYELVNEGNRENIASRCNELLNNADRAFREQEKLMANTELFESIAKKEDQLLQEFVTAIESHVIDGENAKGLFINGMRDFLSDNPNNFEVTAEELYEQIKNGDIKFTESYFEQITEQLETILLDTYMSSFKFGLNLYRLDAFIAGQEFANSYPENTLLLKYDNDFVIGMVNQINDMTSSTYNVIHKALVDQVDIYDFKEIIVVKSINLKGLLHNASRMLGEFNILAKNNIDNNGDPIQVYSASLSLADAINQLNILVFYLAHAQFKLNTNDDGAWYGGQKRRVKTRGYEYETPKGVTTSISDAINITDNNMLLEIEGIVSDIYTGPDQFYPKFSTFVILKDSTSGNTIKLRAHMHSLINNGLFKGSYCKINGYVIQQAEWLEEGEVGFDIDRFSLVDLSKESWLADVVYEMKPYHKLYPDEMNMVFTP